MTNNCGRIPPDDSVSISRAWLNSTINESLSKIVTVALLLAMFTPTLALLVPVTASTTVSSLSTIASSVPVMSTITLFCPAGMVADVPIAV